MAGASNGVRQCTLRKFPQSLLGSWFFSSCCRPRPSRALLTVRRGICRRPTEILPNPAINPSARNTGWRAARPGLAPWRLAKEFGYRKRLEGWSGPTSPPARCRRFRYFHTIAMLNFLLSGRRGQTRSADGRLAPKGHQRSHVLPDQRRACRGGIGPSHLVHTLPSFPDGSAR